MSIKRTIITTIVGLTLVALVAPAGAQALTTAETIAQLMATISGLTAQLNALQGNANTGGTANYAGIPAGFTFTKNIPLGTVSQDVVYLKAVLIGESCGNGITSTTYYGPKTKANVQCFQNKYKTQISAFAGYTIASTGLVGTGTRAQLNALLSGTPGTPVPPVTPSASGLSVALAYDTPASTSIADATNANFTKFTLTAGASGSVSISKLYVTRAGLSANSIVENIKIVEADTGTYRGTVGSLNADNRSMITFTPALVIPAGTTKAFFIRAGIVDATTSGFTVTLGIAANSDIVSNATSVVGAPAIGNAMTTVLLTVGTLAVTDDPSLVDSTPDVGDKDVAINMFKLTAGSAEAVTVETITALQAGTSAPSDSNNIELWDVTNNRSLGTVASWDSEEKATWSNLGLVIAKGESIRLKIMADIVGGVESTALTLNADIEDGSDSLIVGKGNTYGFYLTATNSGDGLGDSYQTINKGALNLAKSASTPATGKTAAGSDVVLGVFDFDARGEEMRISAITVEAVLSGMTYDEVTNIRIFDENGTIVAGPQDLLVGLSASFTDTFIVPIGVHKYTVKAKLASTVGTGDTIVIDINTPGTTTVLAVKGMTSGDTITATPAGDLSANTLTIAAGDLDLKTLATPSERYVAVGVQDYIWATAALSALDSGEAVQVTTITVNDDTDTASGSATGSTAGTLGDPDDIDNAELWADLTTANSTRGDIYETKISNTEQPTGNANDATNTQAFTLTQTVTVPAGQEVKVALIADLASGASTTTDVHTWSFSDSTQTGATTGATITETASGAGQPMVVSAGGTLTISKDSSTPVSDIVLGGDTSTIAVFRLAADNIENLDVDDMTFNVTGGAMVDTFYFYNGTTLLGTAAGTTTPKITLADGALVVPANGNVKVTVKAKFIAAADAGLTNNTTITASINSGDKINTTGLASGTEVDSNTNTATSNGYDLYQTRPYVTLATTGQPSTTLNATTDQTLAVFDVRAAAGEDITFEAADGNFVILNVSTTQADTEALSLTYYLKDENGNTLATSSFTDGGTTVTFLFDGNNHTIPAGQTGKWYVSGDLSHLENDGDTIRVWLDDSANNIDWGINGSGSYNDGDKIFRNDISGVTLVNPS